MPLLGGLVRFKVNNSQSMFPKIRLDLIFQNKLSESFELGLLLGQKMQVESSENSFVASFIEPGNMDISISFYLCYLHLRGEKKVSMHNLYCNSLKDITVLLYERSTTV